MTIPSAVFASLPELLRCVAEQIHSRRQLTTLCLVNKTFNGAVTPFLYRELVIGDTEAKLDAACLAKKNHYRHIKGVSVTRCSDYDDLSYQGIVERMLPGMPFLESFTWHGGGIGGLPLPIYTFRALHESCPAIKTIRLTFPDDMGDQVGYCVEEPHDDWRIGEHFLYGEPKLEVFSGLQELTLDNLYEELPWWRSQIVEVLKKSPGLQKLKLSLATETLARYAALDDRPEFENFFDLLCDEYAETGAAPLRLLSLHLGTAVYPYKASSPKKLADLRFLEEVHIENCGVWYEGTMVIDMYNDWEDSGIAFDAFGPAHCPNLRRLNLAEYQRDVHHFVASIADTSFARKLAISSQSMNGGYELAALLRPDPNYPALPLHLRMINIELQRKQVRLFDEDGEDLGEEDIPPARQVLGDLVSGDDGTLEGLAVHLHEDMRVLRCLNLLGNTVGKLANLTQLAVVESIYVEREIELGALEDAARMLAVAAPRLRYIRVYESCWRIWRNRDDTIRLDKLDRDEADKVELFRGLNWEPNTMPDY